MGLSRKNKRELKKLRSHAAGLWHEQREVLDRANSVLQEAADQARKLSDQHVVPKVRDAVDSHVRPGFDRGFVAAKSASSTAKDKIVTDLLPVAASAVGSAMAVFDLAKDSHVRHTVEKAKKAGKVASKAGHKLAARYIPHVEEPKRGIGAGGIVAIAAGVVVAAGVGYAFWQTFRADDDLWIADDEVDGPSTSTYTSTDATPSAPTVPPLPGTVVS